MARHTNKTFLRLCLSISHALATPEETFKRVLSGGILLLVDFKMSITLFDECTKNGRSFISMLIIALSLPESLKLHNKCTIIEHSNFFAIIPIKFLPLLSPGLHICLRHAQAHPRLELHTGGFVRREDGRLTQATLSRGHAQVATPRTCCRWLHQSHDGIWKSSGGGLTAASVKTGSYTYRLSERLLDSSEALQNICSFVARLTVL